jgi:cardiolipin-specific phospholipase
MWLWTSAHELAVKLEGMRKAEAVLLQFAHRFAGRYGPNADECDVRLFDTIIPYNSIPLSSHGCQLHDLPENEYLIHGIHVESRNTESARHASKAPLVLLHGYMNGAAYFYRNLVGLSSYFASVYSLDMLGWGLSSRPKFKTLKDGALTTTEDFFVESLEAWRVANKIDRMILAGHSMGGYLSVAYCERYPEHVERLILLSPVGIPEESQQVLEERKTRAQASIQGRLLYGAWNYLFDRKSPGDILRMLPSSRSERMTQEYVRRRLPAIAEEEERLAVSDYLYRNTVTLPPSGEYCVNRILTPGIFAKDPLVHRIPNLKVPFVSFLYGSQDWMDVNGGLQVQQTVERKRLRKEPSPKVEVFSVGQAGHLLMLDNWKEFNAGVILSAGGVPYDTQWMPTKLETSQVVADLTESLKARESQGTPVLQ